VYENYAYHFGPLALDSPLDFTEPAARLASLGPPNIEDGLTYRVRSGDTLSTIAARHGASIDDLVAMNRLPSDRIFAGETLVVGIANVRDGGGTGVGEYMVRSGDTLSTIAEAHGMTVGELRGINRIVGDRIVAGKTLIVSGGPTPPATEASEYEVRRGDTLGEIARRFGMELRDLMEINKLPNTTIYTGQTLILR
jgi:LysM repeat protein